MMLYNAGGGRPSHVLCVARAIVPQRHARSSSSSPTARSFVQKPRQEPFRRARIFFRTYPLHRHKDLQPTLDLFSSLTATSRAQLPRATELFATRSRARLRRLFEFVCLEFSIWVADGCAHRLPGTLEFSCLDVPNSAP